MKKVACLSMLLAVLLLVAGPALAGGNTTIMDTYNPDTGGGVILISIGDDMLILITYTDFDDSRDYSPGDGIVRIEAERFQSPGHGVECFAQRRQLVASADLDAGIEFALAHFYCRGFNPAKLANHRVGQPPREERDQQTKHRPGNPHIPAQCQ